MFFPYISIFLLRKIFILFYWVLIAKSITESANIYIWDEPLNYIDILTRIQIEDAILKYKPTLIFVEHDETFIKKVATNIIQLKTT